MSLNNFLKPISLILIALFLFTSCSQRVFVDNTEIEETFPKNKKNGNIFVGDILLGETIQFDSFELLESNEKFFVAAVSRKSKIDTLNFKHSETTVSYDKFSKAQTISSLISGSILTGLIIWTIFRD
ncbi:MAG: hypothetical protein DWQ06_14075 [Calditrichaeota bacterium]|nr:MAG: hypothetical protein DWQ06_14075 [Calditrichota bacterium]